MKLQTKNPNIKILRPEPIRHTKASETYVSVGFLYPAHNIEMEIWVSIEYRRTGVFLTSEEEVEDYLEYVYEELNPAKLAGWLQTQEKFWAGRKADVTRPFFDSLATGGWKCSHCELPENGNDARRIQDLKEDGYTIATDLNRYCAKCGKTDTHRLLLPLPRKGEEGNGYETWSPKLRARIIKVLGSWDVYENRKSSHCLPDHKFPEIRWDAHTKAENPDIMSTEEIRAKFQLLSNQRNLQKREVCRNCFQTGQRGVLFEIPFYPSGSSNWVPPIPARGKDAEKGSVGCPWYDIEYWRKALIRRLLKREK